MADNFATTPSRYFGEMVQSYDSLISRAVPRYREMTESLLDYLPASPESILELGCGTDNLSLRLVQKFPAATLTVVDAAPEMIEVTRARLIELNPGVAQKTEFMLSRFEDLQIEENSFDLIASCISLHHVRDKQPLYFEIYRLLKSGGTFRFADQIRGGSGWNHEKNWQRWLEFCRRPGNCTEEEIQSLLDHAAAHDFYTPLAEHFRFLSTAGFISIDCVWRNLIWGIVTADVSEKEL
jgi:tRNA (cmo5U34)-methyltransferase